MRGQPGLCFDICFVSDAVPPAGPSVHVYAVTPSDMCIFTLTFEPPVQTEGIGPFPGVPGCTPAGLAAEMLIHHNVVISQRSREQSGGMREPWQHGTGGRRADKGLARGKEALGLYWGLGSEINGPGRVVDVDAFMR